MIRAGYGCSTLWPRPRPTFSISSNRQSVSRESHFVSAQSVWAPSSHPWRWLTSAVSLLSLSLPTLPHLSPPTHQVTTPTYFCFSVRDPFCKIISKIGNTEYQGFHSDVYSLVNCDYTLTYLKLLFSLLASLMTRDILTTNIT